MFLFHKGQIVRKGRIVIPDQMCAALALHTGVELDVVETRPYISDLPNELLLTTERATQWPTLWRLRAAYQDRPGILGELTSFLSESNIEIISCRVTSTHQNDFLQVDFWLDTSLYGSVGNMPNGRNGSASGPSVENLKQVIAAHFYEDLLFPYDNKPLLSIRRSLPLQSAQETLLNRDSIPVKDGTISLPKRIIDSIRSSFLTAYSNISRLKGQTSLPIAYLVTDTENCILRVLLVYRNTGHVHFRLRVKRKVGNLSALATKLTQAHINILQLYSRSISGGNYALMDVLGHLDKNHDSEKNDAKLKHFIRELIRNIDPFDNDYEVTFPKIIENKQFVGL